MLFNPLHDPFSLQSLIAWLETKDPSETYDYHNCSGHCLISQYAGARGMDSISGYLEISGRNGGLIDIAMLRPHTFGAALTRAREALP